MDWVGWYDALEVPSIVKLGSSCEWFAGVCIDLAKNTRPPFTQCKALAIVQHISTVAKHSLRICDVNIRRK